MNAKNAGDWPIKRPMAVRNLSAPMAAPFVSVGRKTEKTGSVGLRQGAWLRGIINSVSKSSPAKRRRIEIRESYLSKSRYP